MIEIYLALALFVTMGLVFAFIVQPVEHNKKQSN